MAPNNRLIQAIAEEFQGLRVSAGRAAELALELERLNTEVRAAATVLRIDNDPAAFAALLGRQVK